MKSKRSILSVANDVDVAIIEIGGTVGRHRKPSLFRGDPAV